MTTWAEFMKRAHAGSGLPRAVLDDLTCAACRSHEATAVRLDALVCAGCAHMIDVHGASLHDAHAVDPCEAGG